MSKKCHFHDSWKSELDFSSWLNVVADDVHRAYCRTCKKTFDVGNMGVAAVKSHRKASHMLKFQGLLDHPLRQLEVSLSTHGVSSRSSDTSGSTLLSTSYTSLDTTVVTGDVIRAEVLWTLKVVMCHYSFNSCNISRHFEQCFLTVVLRRFSPVEQPSAHI